MTDCQDLQHKQTIAIIKAMNGDNNDLINICK